MSKLDVIILPLHRNIDRTISSESYWSLIFLKLISKKYTTKAYVGNISSEGVKFLGTDMINVTTFKLGEDRTIIADLLFYFMLLKYNLKNILRTEIIHHYGSFGFLSGFNLSFMIPRFGRRYIIGPILYPTKEEDDIAIRLGLLKEQHNYNKMLKIIFRLLNKLTLFRSNSIIFDCEETKQIYESNYPFLRKKTVWIIPGGGVDNTTFFPIRSNHYGRKLILGIASNLIKSKNIDKIVSALRFTDSNIILKIAGDGPEKINLSSLVNELNLSNRVSFMGRIMHNELAEFYHELDVYVALSNVPTSVKISVQEAMSCGCAIISGEQLIGENIKESEWGIIVNPDSLEAIKTAINQIYCDRDKLILMKENATKFAQANYSGEAILGNISEVYDSYIVKKDEK